MQRTLCYCLFFQMSSWSWRCSFHLKRKVFMHSKFSSASMTWIGGLLWSWTAVWRSHSSMTWQQSYPQLEDISITAKNKLQWKASIVEVLLSQEFHFQGTSLSFSPPPTLPPLSFSSLSLSVTIHSFLQPLLYHVKHGGGGGGGGVAKAFFAVLFSHSVLLVSLTEMLKPSVIKKHAFGAGSLQIQTDPSAHHRNTQKLLA